MNYVSCILTRDVRSDRDVQDKTTDVVHCMTFLRSMFYPMTYEGESALTGSSNTSLYGAFCFLTCALDMFILHIAYSSPH
jgi:hypothetical protein